MKRYHILYGVKWFIVTPRKILSTSAQIRSTMYPDTLGDNITYNPVKNMIFIILIPHIIDMTNKEI